MVVQQAITKPYGVNVFGSSIIRIEPDIASLNFAVSRLEKHPRDAFGHAREAAEKVRIYLDKAGIDQVGTSRITLSQSSRYVNGEHKFLGYVAQVGFHVLLKDLNRIEEILIGVTDAGANEIGSVQFQTSQLKQIRAQARQQAVATAREKAAIYCKAADVNLGTVIHIEDVNPEQLRGQESHVVQEAMPDDGGPLAAFDPGSIVVGGAVMVSFKLEN